MLWNYCSKSQFHCWAYIQKAPGLLDPGSTDPAWHQCGTLLTLWAGCSDCWCSFLWSFVSFVWPCLGPICFFKTLTGTNCSQQYNSWGHEVTWSRPPQENCISAEWDSLLLHDQCVVHWGWQRAGWYIPYIIRVISTQIIIPRIKMSLIAQQIASVVRSKTDKEERKTIRKMTSEVKASM